MNYRNTDCLTNEGISSPQVINDPQSTLGLAVAACLESEKDSDENPTDESGSDSDGAESTSSSYSSLSDFVFDIQNSDITGDLGG